MKSVLLNSIMFLVLAILLSACTSNKESTSEGVEDFDSPVYSGEI